MAKKRAKDMDPKSGAKKVKGGKSLWQDNKGKLPLRTGKVVDDVAIKPVQNLGKTH
jgi:hypothetical protein